MRTALRTAAKQARFSITRIGQTLHPVFYESVHVRAFVP